MQNIKVMVITLTIGEPQLELQKEQLALQEGVDIEHLIIENKTAVSAMQLFIEICRERKRDFDYVVKLDGDMTLGGSTSILEMVKQLKSTELNRLTLTVFDFVLRMRIYGVHIFVLNAMPENIKITEQHRDDWLLGMSGVIRKCGENHVLHCQDPTPLQLYTFGFNRGLKTKYKKQDFRYVFIVSLVNLIRDNSVKYCIQGFMDATTATRQNHDKNYILEFFSSSEELTFISVVVFFCKMNPWKMVRATLQAVSLKTRLR